MRRLCFVLCATLLGCSGGATMNPSSGPSDDNTSDAGAGDLPVSVGLVSLSVEPKKVELESIDGARVKQEFRAIGTYDDGSKRPVSGVRFELEALDLGEIDAQSGVFTAHGTSGGEVRVRAHARSNTGPVQGEATLRVRVSREILGPNLPPDARDRFNQTPVNAPARSASVVYPLEGAVMPQNVFPADVQWLVGANEDLFEVRLEKPHARVRVLLRHSGTGFGNHYLVDEVAWRSLAASDPNRAVSVRVRRWEAASRELIEGTTSTFSFARAALTGSIYYWDIEAGRIVRIDDGTNKAVQFMPSPAQGCVGCHSISPSGRYMGGRHGGGENWGGVYDLTTDLSGNPPASLFPAGSTNWWFSSWSPDEKRMVVSQVEAGARSLGFVDPFTGKAVTVKGSMPSGATHPAWSPDGKQIAYVANANNWGGQNTSGDIAVLPVTGTDAVGAPTILHNGASTTVGMPAGSADSYPTWAPDSSRIAFSHGTGSRSENQKGALYLMGRDGGRVVRLDKACGETVNNFQPRFSPFDSGGYFWLSFLSRRDYGNAEVGTKGKDLQQIWVTAIKKDAKPGEDPSQVGYWVPGQRATTRNISAYWAPRACRKDGEACSVGSECCGGDCRPNAAGELVCSPPTDECRPKGETCSDSADCCGGLLCEGNVCIYPVVL